MVENGASSKGALWFFSAAMFSVGMQMAETGAALERMTRTLALDSTQQGLLVSVRFIGGIVVGFLLWAGHSRFSIRKVLVAAVVLLTFSGILLLYPSYPSALLVATLRGLSVGAIIPLSGMFAAAQKRWSPGLVASTVNAGVSAGLVLLSLIALLLSSSSSIPWQAYWVVSSAIGLVLLAVLPRVSFPGEEAPIHGPEARRSAPAPGGTDWLLAFAGLLVVGSESVLLGLIPAKSVAVAPLAFGGELYALILMSGILLGRTAGAFLFRLVSTFRVIGGSVAIVAVAGGLWSFAPGLAPVSVFLSGLGTATLFPGLVAFVSERSPGKAGATMAAIGWTGGIGGTVVPALTGLVLSAGAPNRVTSLFVVVAALGAFALILRRNQSASGNRPRVL